MRPKGLTQAEIEKITNFDWDVSEDEENEEEEEKTVNFENIIEETLKNVIDSGENMEVNLIEELNSREDVGTGSENREVLQEMMEKINFQSLRWRSQQFTDCNTTWKSEVLSNEVKQPIEYFFQFFTDEVWQKICEETNLYALQSNGTELKCNVFEIKRYVGILLYLAVVNIPTYRMAWAENFKLAAVGNALPRNRFEKIKQFLHFNNNAAQTEKGQPGYDKLYKVRPLLNFIKSKFNAIPQEEFQSVDEQMIAYKGI